MICGTTDDSTPKQDVQMLNYKNYLRCLRLLKESMKDKVESETSQFPSEYQKLTHYISNEERLAIEQKIQTKIEYVRFLESKSNGIQSMINFLKSSPHKFDVQLCDSFLKKNGLYEEFNNVVQTYLNSCIDKLDLTGVESFTSESNLIDISNRSILKSELGRKSEIKKGSSRLTNVLTAIDAQIPQPSKHVTEKRRLLKSEPRTNQRGGQFFGWGLKDKKSKSEKLILKPPIKTQKLLSLVKKKVTRQVNREKPIHRFVKDIDAINLLFVNEIKSVKLLNTGR